MGLTPFLRYVHQGKISQEDLDIVRERNLKNDIFTPYKAPEKYSRSIPTRVIKTTYDDRNWTSMDETNSNASGGKCTLWQQILGKCKKETKGETTADNNYKGSGLTKSEYDAVWADMDKAGDEGDGIITEEYKKSGSTKSFEEWYKGWKDTEGGQLVMGGIKTGIASIWDKIFPPSTASTSPPIPLADDKGKISPLVWGLIAVGGIAILITVLVLVSKGSKKEVTTATA